MMTWIKLKENDCHKSAPKKGAPKVQVWDLLLVAANHLPADFSLYEIGNQWNVDIFTVSDIRAIAAKIHKNEKG